ncbi:ABC transporter substrate-binding protein [Paenibacillus humicola]|uniref:ABC transporter substrate-binding protein n=1 Tax=Paenibacillus humicola TaxID=3110540 RepID=UPI00237B52BF|nr:sugar ABC transporter substrate-binding protein [Paenibacillus humicola]
MKKRYIFLIALSLVVVLGAFSVTGFTKNAVTGKTTISWLVRSDPNANPWERDIVKSFEQKHPNVHVSLMIVPQAQIDQKMQTMFASGSVPDVLATNWANAGFATYKDYLMDLKPFMEKDPDAIKGFNQKLIDIYTIDGHSYGMPILGLGSFLFYNKDLLDAAGLPYPPTDWDDKSWTWDKMIEYAKKLTKNTDNPQKAVYGINDALDIAGESWLFGGDYFKPEAYVTGDMGTPTVLTDPAVKKAVQARYDLVNKYKVSPNTSEMKAITALGDPFLTGKIAMTMTGGWGFSTYKPATFHWGVAALPYTQDNRHDVLYVDTMNIPKASKHPELAWELIKEILNPADGLKQFMLKTQNTPPEQGLLEQWAQTMSKSLGMPADKIIQVNEGAIKYGKEAPNHMIKYYDSISNVLNQSLGAVWDGRKSVDQGLKEVDSNLRSLQNLK